MTHNFPGDELHDLELSEDREVFVSDTNDLAITHGEKTVIQSVAIAAGNVLRPLIGQPLDGKTYEDIQQELKAVLQRDPQIDNVDRVRVNEVNEATGEVTVEIVTSYDESFEIEVPVQ